jgi:putative transposase
VSLDRGERQIKLPRKIGKVYCVQDRKFVGQIKTVTVSLNPDGKYFASILVDDGKETPIASSEGKAMGACHICDE